MIYDAIILGSGAMGAAAALALARRGLVTLAFDRHAVPNTLSEHFGAARMLRTAYYEHPSYVPLLLESRERWLALNHAASRTLFHATGGLYMGPPTGEVVPGSLRSAAQHNLPHERLSLAQIRERFPEFHPPASSEAVFEPLAGVIEPEEAIAAMARLARESGASIGTHEEVLHLEPRRELTVVTDRSRYRTRHVIVTAGAWSQTLLRESGFHTPTITATRQPLGWFKPTGAEAFRPSSAMPAWALEDGPGSLLYGFPILPGHADFRVARHHRGNPIDPSTLDRTVHPADLADFEPGVRALLPRCGEVSRAAIAHYSLSGDGHFIIDRLPDDERVLLATGMSGHGFKFAPVVGEILADLVQHGETPRDIALFSLDRPSLSTGISP